jgi:hypothetical protein
MQRGIEMPKAARVSRSFAVSTASSERSVGHPLVPIALLSGIGLLASLIEVILGFPLAWY